MFISSSRAFQALSSAERKSALSAPHRIRSRFEAHSTLGLNIDDNVDPGSPGEWGINAPLDSLDVCDCLLQLDSDSERASLLMTMATETSVATIVELRLRGNFGDFLTPVGHGATALRTSAKNTAKKMAKQKKKAGDGYNSAVVDTHGVAILEISSVEAAAKFIGELPTKEATAILSEMIRRCGQRSKQSSGPNLRRSESAFADEWQTESGTISKVVELLSAGSTAAILASAPPLFCASLLTAFSSTKLRSQAFRRLSVETQARTAAVMSPEQRAATLELIEEDSRPELEAAIDVELGGRSPKSAQKKKGFGFSLFTSSKAKANAKAEKQRAASESSEPSTTQSAVDKEKAELAKILSRGSHAMSPAETQRVQELMEKQKSSPAGDISPPEGVPRENERASAPDLMLNDVPESVSKSRSMSLPPKPTAPPPRRLSGIIPGAALAPPSDTHEEPTAAENKWSESEEDAQDDTSEPITKSRLMSLPPKPTAPPPRRFSTTIPATVLAPPSDTHEEPTAAENEWSESEEDAQDDASEPITKSRSMSLPPKPTAPPPRRFSTTIPATVLASPSDAHEEPTAAENEWSESEEDIQGNEDHEIASAVTSTHLEVKDTVAAGIPDEADSDDEWLEYDVDGQVVSDENDDGSHNDDDGNDDKWLEELSDDDEVAEKPHGGHEEDNENNGQSRNDIGGSTDETMSGIPQEISSTQSETTEEPEASAPTAASRSRSKTLEDKQAATMEMLASKNPALGAKLSALKQENEAKVAKEKALKEDAELAKKASLDTSDVMATPVEATTAASAVVESKSAEEERAIVDQPATRTMEDEQINLETANSTVITAATTSHNDNAIEEDMIQVQPEAEAVDRMETEQSLHEQDSPEVKILGEAAEPQVETEEVVPDTVEHAALSALNLKVEEGVDSEQLATEVAAPVSGSLDVEEAPIASPSKNESGEIGMDVAAHLQVEVEKVASDENEPAAASVVNLKVEIEADSEEAPIVSSSEIESGEVEKDCAVHVGTEIETALEAATSGTELLITAFSLHEAENDVACDVGVSTSVTSEVIDVEILEGTEVTIAVPAPEVAEMAPETFVEVATGPPEGVNVEEVSASNVQRKNAEIPETESQPMVKESRSRRRSSVIIGTLSGSRSVQMKAKESSWKQLSLIRAATKVQTFYRQRLAIRLVTSMKEEIAEQARAKMRAEQEAMEEEEKRIRAIENARLQAEREAKEKEEERVRAIEAARLQAEREAKEEEERVRAIEAARLQAEREAKEKEEERVRAIEAARLQAEREAKEKAMIHAAESSYLQAKRESKEIEEMRDVDAAQHFQTIDEIKDEAIQGSTESTHVKAEREAQEKERVQTTEAAPLQADKQVKEEAIEHPVNALKSKTQKDPDRIDVQAAEDILSQDNAGSNADAIAVEVIKPGAPNVSEQKLVSPRQMPREPRVSSRSVHRYAHRLLKVAFHFLFLQWRLLIFWCVLRTLYLCLLFFTCTLVDRCLSLLPRRQSHRIAARHDVAVPHRTTIQESRYNRPMLRQGPTIGPLNRLRA